MLIQTHLDRIAERLRILEQAIAEPGVAANQKKYRELVREHSRVHRMAEQAEAYSRLRGELCQHQALIAAPDTDSELRDLAKAELGDLEQSLQKAERDLVLAMLPSDGNDERNVIMEIRAGTGGDEAALFAGELFRMYNKYCESRGWKIGLIDASASSIGGYKEVVFAVEGERVYSVLKYESGCHRVQRVPVTESSGRIHTSAVTVAVLPEAEEVDEIEIPAADIRVDIFCSSGPGGQGVNTTYSAIRITHLPTGLVAQSQDERSQHRNKDKAMTVLKTRLLDWHRCQEEERSGTLRRNMIGTGDRSEKIRTYNFPQNRLTDHRINFTLYSLNRVMEGAIDELLAELQTHDLESRLKEIQ